MADNVEASEPIAGAEHVVARYRWTLDELQNAYRNHYRYSSSDSVRFAMIIICAIGLIGSSVLFATQSVPDHLAIVPILFVILLAIAWFGRGLTVSRYSARSQFRRRPDQDMDFEWRFGPEEIRTQSKLGEGRSSWLAFIKVVTTPEGLLIYSLEQFWHWLPRHAFLSDAEFERVIVWAEQKVPVHRRR